MTRSAAVYVRISDDRNAEAAGVQRQERDCRELANRLGWAVADVYVENDTSAFKRRRVTLADGSTALRVIRPAFRKMLDDLIAGTVDAVVGYDLDRVARDPRDLEDLIDVVEARKVPTHAVTGSLDLSTDAGITMARVMVAVANKSSRDTARRVARKHVELAEGGRVGGGGIRAFGYDRDGITVNDAEAAVVRDIAARVLAGQSLTSIAAHLNAAGVPTVRGGVWQSRSVHAVVTKARVAGLREHRGEVVGAAVWPAILDRDTWERVRLALDGRAHGATNTLKRWLSGTLTCPACRHPLVGWSANGGGHRYWCATPKGGCGRIAIDAERAEDAVERMIVDYLSRSDVLNDLRASTSTASIEQTRADMTADDHQLRELAELWATRSITTGEYMAARKSIEARLEKHRGMLRASLPAAVRQLAKGDIATTWANYLPAQRREVARIVFPDGIDVAPRASGSPRVFDPTRLRPIGWQIPDSA